MENIKLSSQEIRTQMMQLWKDTFHDSDDYINLIFNNYFDINLVEYEERDGKLIAAMLAIPYTFYALDSDKTVKGLYLCGLSTLPEYRSMGLMSKLIENINKHAYNDNYAFTFLIPANVGLQRYYEDRNYIKSCFKSENIYIEDYDFSKLIKDKNINVEILLGSDCIINMVALSDIVTYLNTRNTVADSFDIYRTEEDAKVILEENSMAGGTVLVALNNAKNIIGLLFSTINSDSKVSVQKLVADSSDIKYLLLQKLQSYIHDKDGLKSKEIIVQSESADDIKQIYSPYVNEFSDEFSEGVITEHDEVYNSLSAQKVFAMSRICKLSEVLIFATALCPAREYSILVKEDDFAENRGLHVCKDGKYSYTPLDSFTTEELTSLEKKLAEDLNGYVLSVRGVSELLWRHGSDPLVDDVISIPRLPLNISLMLE